MDNFEFTENNIELLIIRYLDGIASDEDTLKLQDWLEQSDENFSLFTEYRKHWLRVGRVQRYNTGKGWEQLSRQMDGRTRKRRRHLLLRVSGYAATAILLISLGVYFVQRQQIKPVDETPQETIEPGSKKAILVLGSNREVILDNHHEDTLLEHNSIIKKQDNTLVYSGGAENNADEFNRLITPRGGVYSVVLCDGTKVWLNSESELRYPVRFVGKERKVYLKGEAYFAVTKQKGQTFVVCSDDAVITVLGTEFNVRNYNDGAIAATLVKGSIVASGNGAPDCRLEPGEQAVFGKNGIEIRKVETIFYTAWKDGFFVYQDRPLDDIMKELSRWYDFNYFYENKGVQNVELTARLKKFDNVDQIFEILSQTGRFGFVKKGKTITVVAK